MKIQNLLPIVHLPKKHKVEIKDLVNAGFSPVEIYFLIRRESDFGCLLTIPLRMFGNKSNTGLAQKLIKKILKSKKQIEKGEKFICYFDADSADIINERKIVHEKSFHGYLMHEYNSKIRGYLLYESNIWMDSSIPIELLPLLAKAFDITNASN